MSDGAAVVRELFERGLAGGDIDVIDRLVAPDLRFTHPGVPAGREGLGLLVELENDAFDGWAYTVEDVVVQDDLAAVRWTVRGNHGNTYLGEGPTGRDVTHTGMSFLRVHEGVVTEMWSQADSLGLLQQLGILPAMSIVD